MEHIPVMRGEISSFLKQEGIFIDATTGTGGHSFFLLNKFPKLRVICIDKDRDSLEQARKKLAEFGERARLIHSDYRNLPEIDLQWEKVVAVLFDMGLSSYQLSSDRGFSHMRDSPLDMRFNKEEGKPAYVFLREISYSQLVRIFRDYADLRRAEELARNIKAKNMKSTGDLIDTVREVYGMKKKELLSRIFQAVRIGVNRELEGIEEMISSLGGIIPKGTRLIFITYHSGEDRIVKNSLRHMERNGKLRILTKKVIRPERKEVLQNPRARSAKMRVAEK